MLIRNTFAEIDLSALRHNLSVVKNLAPKNKIIAMVKANAYGHGDVSVAKTLIENGIHTLAVATIEEGIRLRNYKIKAPILILGSAYPGEFSHIVEYLLTPVFFDIENLSAFNSYLEKENKKWPVQIKFDTGMHRLGIQPEECKKLLLVLEKSKHIYLEGIFSHFAQSDLPKSPYTKNQIRTFHTIVSNFSNFTIPMVHINNSGGIFNKLASFCNTVRPGIMLYGAYPSKLLKPVMSVKATILAVKELPKGASIGYACTYKLKQKSKVATLTIGYADGISRLFSNKGHVVLHGKKAPILGRVTMDYIMVDCTRIPQTKIHDMAVILGESITAESLGKIIGTSPYEILCAFSHRVPRIYKN